MHRKRCREYSTETFNECSRLVYSGRVQAGIQASINDLLLVRGREAGITERTASLRHQMHQDRAQTARLDATAAGINAAYSKRWHRLGGMAALCALAVLLLCVYNAR